MDTSHESFPFAIPLGQINQSESPISQLPLNNNWNEHAPGPPSNYTGFVEPLLATAPPLHTVDTDDESDDEEAPPNDLMIEMNAIPQETRPLISSGLTGRISDLRRQRPSPGRSVRPPPPPRREDPNLLRRNLFGPQPLPEERTANESDAMKKKMEVFRIWSQVDNLDDFLQRVYTYYTDKGMTCILLSRITNLITLAFIVGFSTFLISCIDYSAIAPKKTLHDVLRHQCAKNIHGLHALFIITFCTWWVWQVFRMALDVPRLWEIKLLYEHVLEIKEAELDTIHWREVIQKLLRLRESPIPNPAFTPALDKLDAHSIANRILRKENYLIAMFNRNILDLKIPYLGDRQMFTKIMEWNLSFCILSYIFDENGTVRKRFLRRGSRVRLVAGLKKRFAMMALLNLMFAPFLMILMVMFFFFRYAEEYQKNPSSIGARQYSPYARLKFREFNELPDIFQKRLNRSYDKATKYMEQFPKEKIIIVARFVSFVTGSFAAVLALLTLVDQELLLGFEITHEKSVLFYIGIFSGLAAVTRGMIPDENQVLEPERWLREVAEETHYLPDEWRSKLHREEVKLQFAVFFDYKILLFIQEVLSVVFAPIILYYTLPKCSEAIIDFVRDFTVELDSVGHVCSYAVFNLKAHGNPQYGAPADPNNPHLRSRDGKLEHSLLNFKAHNPQWEPGLEGSQFLQNFTTRSRLQLPSRNDGSHSFENSLYRPRRTVKFSQPYDNGVRAITESILGASEMDVEERPMGLFGLLDAIYESNKFRV
ncbi:autophagy protein atg9 [Chytridiales sp. JEL 0842]|nr:autophagy protein atg9 [Chytridiales sp. JEL 0842]